MLRFFQVTLLGACLGSILTVGAAWSAPLVTACGATLNSITKTETAGYSTSSTAFGALPGARVVVSVPANQTRCIRVVFTAETKCDDLCYIRVFDNGIRMNPITTSAGDLVFDGKTDTAATHAFAWVRRVGPGNHTITIYVRSSTAFLSFYFFAWTMMVEITK